MNYYQPESVNFLSWWANYKIRYGKKNALLMNVGKMKCKICSSLKISRSKFSWP